MFKLVHSLQRWSQGHGPIPWAAAITFAALPFFLLIMVSGKILGAIDTRPVVPTAISLVREGNLDLDEFAQARRNPLVKPTTGELLGCYQEIDGRIYSAYPWGMTPFATAVVGPSWVCGAKLDDPNVHWRLEKITSAAVGAAALSLFFLCASRLSSISAAGVVTVLLATGSGLWTTIGLGLWQHGGIVIGLTLALLIEFQTNGRPGLRGTIGQGVCFAMMLNCRPTAVPLIALFVLWIVMRSLRRGLLLGVTTALTYLPWLGLSLATYGTPFGPKVLAHHVEAQYWQPFRVDYLLGVLFSPARGLLIYQPWTILVTFASLPLSWSRSDLDEGPRGWRFFAGAAVTAHIAVLSSWALWSGGWCWGSRLMTDVLPLLGLLTLPAVTALLRSRAGWAILATLAITGGAMHAPCGFAHGEIWNARHDTEAPADLWSWADAPFLNKG